MNKLTQEEAMFLLNLCVDANQKNASSFEKYPDNKSLEVKLSIGKKVQAKLALFYAELVKEFA